MIRTLYHHTVILILTSFFAFAAGCSSSGPGPDSISSHRPHSRGPISTCTKCHNSTSSPALDPLATNGTGTNGKHVKHFQEHGIACERCHYNYQNAATHMNGTFDKGNPALVNMNIVGPAGAWDPATGRCSGVACHGSTPLLWYSTNTWTTPSACSSCHASGFSPALDPAATNGSSPNGRHTKHVTSRNIGCERCHYQYPTKTTHANGLLDTPDPTVTITFFNIVGTSGSWTNDTGAGTGQCANISCHGTDTLGWYGTGTWTLPATCTTCHSSSYSSLLDPLVTNGTDTAGKHINHVMTVHIVCSRCHLDYPARAPHANGNMDTQDATVLLVYFDDLNSNGTWTNDTGPESGNCASLLCHGTDNPAWYGIGGVSSLSCAACHGGPIGSRRQIFGVNGDFGANPNMTSHHVTGGPGVDPLTDQCLVCHDMSLHMGGAVRLKNADTGTAIAYDPASPSTLEPFCLSCHDAAGAGSTFITGGTPTSPFNDGSILGSPPYAYATRIYTSWTSTNGHGPNGNHATDKKLTCLGTGQPGTGCHGSNGVINAHGSVNQVLASQPFKYDNNNIYNAADFALCFNCHASYPGFTKEDILGVKENGILDWSYYMSPYGGRGTNGWNPPYTIPAVMTHFADHNEAGGPYNDYSSWGENMNLHWGHIGIPISDFRGTGVWSGVNCVNCHDVHGSTTPYGAVYDEIGYTNMFPDATNAYGRMRDEAYLDYLLEDNHPTYCAFNCHYQQGLTRAWYRPITE
jgi:hypothetical protein